MFGSESNFVVLVICFDSRHIGNFVEGGGPDISLVSPRNLRASRKSFGKTVTLDACIAERLAFSNRTHRYASAATCKASKAADSKRRSCLQSCAYSQIIL